MLSRIDCQGARPKLPISALICAMEAVIVGLVASPATAFTVATGAAFQENLKSEGSKLEVAVRRGAAVRRTTVVGPRGGAASRTVVRRGAVVRPGYAGGGVRWARPAHYRWPRGGAIAAGAAIGFGTAATAAAWAGTAPAPGMCWYYTDPSRTQGFWDYCQ